MNKLDVNQVGGFPLTTRILDEIQKIAAVFNGLGGIAGDMTILSGCTLEGSTVSDGVVYVNDEVFLFKGGLQQTKVLIKEDTENLIFENNESKTVIRIRYVTFGTGVGSMDWADFKRGIQTKDLQDLFTVINTTLSAINTKLATIATGAEVNVAANWNITDPLSDAYIHNKPDISSPFLKKGTYPVGDPVGRDTTRIITFDSVGTVDYMVLGTLASKGNAIYDNDINFMIKKSSITETSFEILLNDTGSTSEVQNLDFNYVLIRL